MIRLARYAGLFALLACTACEPAPQPLSPDLGPAPPAADAVLSPTTYFAVTPLPGKLSPGDLTNAGEVVGVAWNDAGTDRTSDFYWAPGDPSVTPIPTVPVPGLFFPVTASETGIVVGTTDDCDQPIFEHCAYAWSALSGRTDLPPLSDHRSSSAFDVNDAGVVVGHSDLEGGRSATRWRLPEGFLRYVGPPGLEGAPYTSQARAINDAGVIVGGATLADFSKVPFQWTESGGFQVLSALQTAVEGVAAASGRSVSSVTPNSINESGAVAGFWSATTGGGRNAFVWDPTTGLADLNTLGGFADAVVLRINDSGQASLVVFTEGAGRQAWVWSPTNGLIHLPEPDPGRTRASAINDEGQVVGSTLDLQGLVWTPLEDADEVLDALEDTLDDVLTTSPAAGGQGLEAKLDRIREHLAAGRANAARNQLDAFLNQVDAMEADGRLSTEDAARLRTAAEALGALLPAA